ncbi:LSM domain-containing protein [Pseudovirgaria hyperparasitica]|uniref:Sm protein F n=1 Tax=Pseudovirgaria hyperparasitica TaxID=470096 RepID=A0A6A6WHM8_9PEZI|nr:LSM domain-containing protein [Pseudovirgaria hyperparasitica]KAF2761496.1 LSM domain-containing protein [Pseudovirgaria hyperparasitica]
MSFVPLNPRPMLQNLVNNDVIVRLKWGQTEYKGKLISVDSYMNIQLAGTEEFIDGSKTGDLGLHVDYIGRCNNVLWISAADKHDASMSG